jgi:hypothetical protein
MNLIRITNECVTIKCDKCGEVYCFYPSTVMFPPECKCGNKDSGNCLRDWPQNKFGNFTFVSRVLETIAI